MFCNKSTANTTNSSSQTSSNNITNENPNTGNTELGNGLFNLIDSLGTDEQETNQGIVNSMVDNFSQIVCDPSKRNDLSTFYKNQILLIVEYCQLLNRHEFNNSNFSKTDEHTPTGTHSPVSDKSCEDTMNARLSEIKNQIVLYSSLIGNIISECRDTNTEDISKFFGVCSGVLIGYNKVKNIEGKMKEAANLRKEYIKLWSKMKMD